MQYYLSYPAYGAHSRCRPTRYSVSIIAKDLHDTTIYRSAFAAWNAIRRTSLIQAKIVNNAGAILGGTRRHLVTGCADHATTSIACVGTAHVRTTISTITVVVGDQ